MQAASQARTRCRDLITRGPMDRRRHRTVSWSGVLALSLIFAGGSVVWPLVAAATSDTTPPTVYSPVVRFRPLVTFGSYPQVSITIVGRDAGSGMGGTPQWAISRNGGAFNRLTPTSSTTTWSDISNGVPHTAAVVIYRTLVLDGTYRFAGRMFDRAGNLSRWVYGPTISPRIIQETATNIVYSDGWVRANNNLWSWEETGGPGETATMKVYARAFAWVRSTGR